jgi:RNA polymerase sigma-70 factor (ECF subfamily)
MLDKRGVKFMSPQPNRAAAHTMQEHGLAIAPRPESMYAAGKQERKSPVEFFSFDAEYVQRLSEGDPATERHFAEYFGSLLLIKLRGRLKWSQDIEDLRQEVFLRVLRSLRTGSGLHEPSRLGAYVNAVCNNVVFEHFRQRSRVTQLDVRASELRESGSDPEQELVTEESQFQVRKLIGELSERDRGILRAVFLEERDKDAVCREYGVRRDYLRVLLHRAKNRFRHLLFAGGESVASQEAASSGYAQ